MTWSLDSVSSKGRTAFHREEGSTSERRRIPTPDGSRLRNVNRPGEYCFEGPQEVLHTQALVPDTYHLLHANRFSESLRDAREGDLFNSLSTSHPTQLQFNSLGGTEGRIPAPSTPSGAIALPSQASVALPKPPSHAPPSAPDHTYP